MNNLLDNFLIFIKSGTFLLFISIFGLFLVILVLILRGTKLFGLGGLFLRVIAVFLLLLLLFLSIGFWYDLFHIDIIEFLSFFILEGYIHIFISILIFLLNPIKFLILNYFYFTFVQDYFVFLSYVNLNNLLLSIFLYGYICIRTIRNFMWFILLLLSYLLYITFQIFVLHLWYYGVFFPLLVVKMFVYLNIISFEYYTYWLQLYSRTWYYTYHAMFDLHIFKVPLFYCLVILTMGLAFGPSLSSAMDIRRRRINSISGSIDNNAPWEEFEFDPQVEESKNYKGIPSWFRPSMVSLLETEELKEWKNKILTREDETAIPVSYPVVNKSFPRFTASINDGLSDSDYPSYHAPDVYEDFNIFKIFTQTNENPESVFWRCGKVYCPSFWENIDFCAWMGYSSSGSNSFVRGNAGVYSLLQFDSYLECKYPIYPQISTLGATPFSYSRQLTGFARMYNSDFGTSYYTRLVKYDRQQILEFIRYELSDLRFKESQDFYKKLHTEFTSFLYRHVDIENYSNDLRTQTPMFEKLYRDSVSKFKSAEIRELRKSITVHSAHKRKASKFFDNLKFLAGKDLLSAKNFKKFMVLYSFYSLKLRKLSYVNLATLTNADVNQIRVNLLKFMKYRKFIIFERFVFIRELLGDYFFTLKKLKYFKYFNFFRVKARKYKIFRVLYYLELLHKYALSFFCFFSIQDVPRHISYTSVAVKSKIYLREMKFFRFIYKRMVTVLRFSCGRIQKTNSYDYLFFKKNFIEYTIFHSFFTRVLLIFQCNYYRYLNLFTCWFLKKFVESSTDVSRKSSYKNFYNFVRRFNGKQVEIISNYVFFGFMIFVALPAIIIIALKLSCTYVKSCIQSHLLLHYTNSDLKFYYYFNQVKNDYQFLFFRGITKLCNASYSGSFFNLLYNNRVNSGDAKKQQYCVKFKSRFKEKLRFDIPFSNVVGRLGCNLNRDLGRGINSVFFLKNSRLVNLNHARNLVFYQLISLKYYEYYSIYYFKLLTITDKLNFYCDTSPYLLSIFSLVTDACHLLKKNTCRGLNFFSVFCSKIDDDFSMLRVNFFLLFLSVKNFSIFVKFYMYTCMKLYVELKIFIISRNYRLFNILLKELGEFKLLSHEEKQRLEVFPKEFLTFHGKEILSRYLKFSIITKVVDVRLRKMRRRLANTEREVSESILPRFRYNNSYQLLIHRLVTSVVTEFGDNQFVPFRGDSAQICGIKQTLPAVNNYKFTKDFGNFMLSTGQDLSKLGELPLYYTYLSSKFRKIVKKYAIPHKIKFAKFGKSRDTAPRNFVSGKRTALNVGRYPTMLEMFSRHLMYDGLHNPFVLYKQYLEESKKGDTMGYEPLKVFMGLNSETEDPSIRLEDDEIVTKSNFLKLYLYNDFIDSKGLLDYYGYYYKFNVGDYWFRRNGDRGYFLDKQSYRFIFDFDTISNFQYNPYFSDWNFGYVHYKKDVLSRSFFDINSNFLDKIDAVHTLVTIKQRSIDFLYSVPETFLANRIKYISDNLKFCRLKKSMYESHCCSSIDYRDVRLDVFDEFYVSSLVMLTKQYSELLEHTFAMLEDHRLEALRVYDIISVRLNQDSIINHLGYGGERVGSIKSKTDWWSYLWDPIISDIEYSRHPWSKFINFEVAWYSVRSEFLDKNTESPRYRYEYAVTDYDIDFPELEASMETVRNYADVSAEYTLDSGSDVLDGLATIDEYVILFVLMHMTGILPVSTVSIVTGFLFCFFSLYFLNGDQDFWYQRHYAITDDFLQGYSGWVLYASELELDSLIFDVDAFRSLQFYGEAMEHMQDNILNESDDHHDEIKSTLDFLNSYGTRRHAEFFIRNAKPRSFLLSKGILDNDGHGKRLNNVSEETINRSYAHDFRSPVNYFERAKQFTGEMEYRRERYRSALGFRKIRENKKWRLNLEELRNYDLRQKELWAFKGGESERSKRILPMDDYMPDVQKFFSIDEEMTYQETGMLANQDPLWTTEGSDDFGSGNETSDEATMNSGWQVHEGAATMFNNPEDFTTDPSVDSTFHQDPLDFDYLLTEHDTALQNLDDEDMADDSGVDEIKFSDGIMEDYFDDERVKRRNSLYTDSLDLYYSYVKWYIVYGIRHIIYFFPRYWVVVLLVICLFLVIYLIIYYFYLL